MKNAVAISIIIPVYNSADFLLQCLDSAVHQTLQSIEILAINDGSTDDSLAILNRYAGQYPNLRVFSQANQGVGATRNSGLQKAQGEYILFLDSDDWIEPNACEILYRQAKENDCDIFCFEFTEVWENKTGKSWQFDKIPCLMNPAEVVAKMLKSQISGHCANKIYRASVLKTNKIEFEKQVIYEELLFNFLALNVSKKTGGVRQYLYNYRQRNASQSKNTNNPQQLDLMRQTQKALAFVREKSDWKIEERLIKRYFSFIYIHILFLAFKSTKPETEKLFLAALAENRNDFSIFTLSPAYFFFYILYKINYRLAKKLFLFLQKCR